MCVRACMGISKCELIDIERTYFDVCGLERKREKERGKACVCVRVCACMCVCVHVCGRVQEKKRKSEKTNLRERV